MGNIFLWSLGNLISTALGFLHSEASDSEDSIETIHEQSENESRFYENSDSEGGKAPLRHKQKGRKKIKSYGSNDHFPMVNVAHPSAPLTEPPPLDPETPWNDILKPLTVPNHISPFQRGIRQAQLQGDEDALALPVVVLWSTISTRCYYF